MARVEQKKGSNKRMKQQHEKWRVAPTLDNESPIQAVCGKAARTDLVQRGKLRRSGLQRRRPATRWRPAPAAGELHDDDKAAERND
jgi:hypothetical protein